MLLCTRARVYIRRTSMGVAVARKIATAITVASACEGGFSRSDSTPGGTDRDGVVLASPVGGAIMRVKSDKAAFWHDDVFKWVGQGRAEQSRALSY